MIALPKTTPNPELDWDSLHKEYNTLLIWLAIKSHGVHSSDAEDVVQDTWLRAFKSCHKWGDIPAINCLRHTLYLAILDYRRGMRGRRSKERFSPRPLFKTNLDWECEELDQGYADQENTILSDCIEALPPELKDCARLYCQGYMMQEITAMRGMTEHQLWFRFRKIRARLARLTGVGK